MSSTLTPATVARLADAVASTDDALDLAERRLAAHAVAWVTAAERLGLEIREEEPEATRARVLAHLGSVPPTTWVAAVLWGAP